jgi:diaminohydroxyphosphoribosylaminopyrimidine deaminase/5-amino-6-(5-phosphoribosylamino)uracil reductase
MTEDEKYMSRCLQLARHGEFTTAPNPQVGAVIVHEGRIIGEGWHRQYGGPHAEVNAVRSVRPEDESLLREDTIYVSLEPCSHWGKTPPCAELLVEKGFRRVVVGCLDPNEKVAGRGIRRLREAGAEVVVGVLERECWWQNRKFMTFHTKHRPFITLKWAQSEDGYIDHLRQDDSTPAVQFSTPLTRTLVHQMRAENQAILVGRRTWELDHPSLTVRHWPGSNPLPIVLSSKSIRMGDETIPVQENTLAALMSKLYQRGIQSLMVEGGAETLKSFIDAGLWDEARVETAPVKLGQGVKAPRLVGEKAKSEEIDGNFIDFFVKKL